MKVLKNLLALVLLTFFWQSSAWSQAAQSIHNHLTNDIVVKGLKVLPDGGTIYTGYRIDGTLSDQMIIVRSDVEGNIIWQKEYGGSGNQQGWNLALYDWYVYLVGTDDYQGSGGKDIFVMKFNAQNGNEQWTKPTYLGGQYDEEVRDITTFGNGDIVLTGSTASYTEDNPGSSNKAIYCARLTSAGALTWQTAAGGISNRSDWGNAIIRGDNVITITGVTTSWSGSGASYQRENIFLLELDYNGSKLNFAHYGTWISSSSAYFTDAGLDITKDDDFYYVACLTAYTPTPPINKDPAILKVRRTDLSTFAFKKYYNSNFPTPSEDMLRFESIFLEDQHLYLTGRGEQSSSQVTFITKTHVGLNWLATQFYDIADDERGFAIDKMQGGEITIGSRVTSSSNDELAILRIHPDLKWEDEVSCNSSSITSFNETDLAPYVIDLQPDINMYAQSMNDRSLLSLTAVSGSVQDNVVCTEFDETLQRKYSNCFDGTSDVYQPQNYYNPNDIIVGHSDKVIWCGSRVWQHITGQNNGDAYPHAFFALMDQDGKNATHLLFKAKDVDTDPGTPNPIDLNDQEPDNDFLSTWAKSINKTADGGYILLGQMQVIELDQFNQYEAKHKDLLVIKLNSSHNIEWTRRIGNTNQNGNYNQEFPGEAIQITDHQGTLDGYLVVGSTRDVNPSYSGDQGDNYVLIAKLSMNGTKDWVRTIYQKTVKSHSTHPYPTVAISTGVSQNINDHAEALIQVNGANNYSVYITGRSDSYPGYSGRSLLMRYNANTEQIDRFNVLASNGGKDLYHDATNNSIVMGCDGALNKVDVITTDMNCNVGNLVEDIHTFDNALTIESLLPDQSDPTQIVIVGTRDLLYSSSTSEYAAMKVSIDYGSRSKDKIIWAKKYADNGLQTMNAGALLPNGNVGMLGYTNATANLCSSPNNTANQHALFATSNALDGHSPECEDVFFPSIITNSQCQNTVWTEEYGSSFISYVETPEVENITPSQADAYTCGLEGQPNSNEGMGMNISKHITNEVFSIYPNPATSLLYVKSTHEVKKMQVYSIDGQLVRNITSANRETLNIDISNLPKGLYTIQVITKSDQYIEQFVKQ